VSEHTPGTAHAVRGECGQREEKDVKFVLFKLDLQ